MIPSARVELLAAAERLADRGLLFSAAWASELAAARPPAPTEREDLNRLRDTLFFGSRAGSEPSDPLDAGALCVAKSRMALREYRAAAAAIGPAGPAELSARLLFLRCYCLYLAEEKERAEAKEDGAPARDEGTPGLAEILADLDSARPETRSDGLVLYLRACVLRAMGRAAEAKSDLRLSVDLFPWNWSAWLDLLRLCTSLSDVASVAGQLRAHWMRDIFVARANAAFQQNEQARDQYSKLLEAFPGSSHFQGQLALVCNNMRDTETADRLLTALHEREPTRLEHMDTYSNVLYVLEDVHRLAKLAHDVCAVDRFRPETCIVVGNYYSLKQQHELAVRFFQRASMLDPMNPDVLVLLGHEYMQMKNSDASIQAYRAAVDLNEYDFKAWYALGLAYKTLGQPLYAMHYYEKACKLRPYDSRMWVALGSCYEALDNKRSAVTCYTRAHSLGNPDGLCAVKLGHIFEEEGRMEDAALWYRQVLRKAPGDKAAAKEVGVELTMDEVHALRFLAEFAARNGNVQEAEAMCTRLLEAAEGTDREAAKQLLLALHKRVAAK
eukprot:m51a1_g4929 hypothetical protein (555) ;mRNA; r:261402-263638